MVRTSISSSALSDTARVDLGLGDEVIADARIQRGGENLGLSSGVAHGFGEGQIILGKGLGRGGGTVTGQFRGHPSTTHLPPTSPQRSRLSALIPW